jgi:hypothetical protein
MTLTVSRLAAILLALAIASPVVVAQTQTPPQAQRFYSQAELDQMLAPVALYPDPLLSQVLMAATYPLEVAAAARWSRANPGLQGDDAVRVARNEDWDPSVKSLVAFPQILARMEENPEWTRRLGEAFLAQEPHVMDTVQQLRQRAQAAGNLQSGEQIRVQQQGQVILLEPANPRYVYVPYYDPRAVYGPWWWSAYQPVAWAPWPGYNRPYRPGISAAIWWGTPVGLSFNFFFGNFDWRSRHVHVAHPAAYYYHDRPPVVVNRTVVVTPNRWQQEPRRREAFAEQRAVQAPRQIHAQPQVQRQQLPEPRPQANTFRSVSVPPAIQARPPVQVQPAAQTQPQVLAQPRVRVPEAIAPQQPRAARQERREMRQEPRNAREPRGGVRS